MREMKPWTTSLVVVISVAATWVGVYNFEWLLNKTCVVQTLPNFSNHCSQK
jgi:pyrroline-5-carboxylate reductase